MCRKFKLLINSSKKSLFFFMAILIVQLFFLSLLKFNYSDIFDIFILQILFIVLFIMLNTAIETPSPTQSLVLCIKNKEKTRQTKIAISEFIKNSNFLELRIHGLIKDGLIKKQHSYFSLTPHGLYIAKLIKMLDKFIGNNHPNG